MAFAALALAGGAITVPLADSTPAAEPPQIVTMVDGKMLCGAVGLDPNATLWLHARPFDQASFGTVVAACPTYR
ncbi:hypothetical protein [Nocardia sp. NPDC004604]|uniref:hypothetical protein n=1 Tax=Nocardia sp. NPDC004604 TaxID=3157013 RepID=UPI0033B2DC42